jgi:hypothetical protein
VRRRNTKVICKNYEEKLERKYREVKEAAERTKK